MAFLTGFAMVLPVQKMEMFSTVEACSSGLKMGDLLNMANFRHGEDPLDLGKFHHDLTVLPNPGIMANKGNHPQMAELFRLVNYYNLQWLDDFYYHLFI